MRCQQTLKKHPEKRFSPGKIFAMHVRRYVQMYLFLGREVRGISCREVCCEEETSHAGLQVLISLKAIFGQYCNRENLLGRVG